MGYIKGKGGAAAGAAILIQFSVEDEAGNLLIVTATEGAYRVVSAQERPLLSLGKGHGGGSDSRQTTLPWDRAEREENQHSQAQERIQKDAHEPTFPSEEWGIKCTDGANAKAAEPGFRYSVASTSSLEVEEPAPSSQRESTSDSPISQQATTSQSRHSPTTNPGNLEQSQRARRPSWTSSARSGSSNASSGSFSATGGRTRQTTRAPTLGRRSSSPSASSSPEPTKPRRTRRTDSAHSATRTSTGSTTRLRRKRNGNPGSSDGHGS